MGLEAKCRVRYARKTSEGDARLESADLLFRGAFRLKIPFTAIRTLEAKDGALAVDWDDERAVFELGKSAAVWADKIRNPKSRLDKLGVKPGMRVAIVGVDDETFRDEVAARGADVSTRLRKECDVIFFGMTAKRELEKLPALRASLVPNGALWAVWPKGKPELREDDIRKSAIESGLVDVKVASFSDTLSALKLVIPVARRAR